MKSHITVIIPSDSNSILKSLNENLASYELDEDNIDMFKHHWDYWYFFNEPLKNEEFIKSYPEETDEIKSNSCFVRNLPESYTTSGVIIDSIRYDLQDYGWRMIDEPSESNDYAMNLWQEQLQQLLKENKNSVCVQIITHC